jgi:hypothetical protein
LNVLDETPPVAGDDEESVGLAELERRLVPCARLIGLCREFGGGPAPAQEDPEGYWAFQEVAGIVERAVGNRTEFGDDEMPLIFEGVLRRCHELLASAEPEEA